MKKVIIYTLRGIGMGCAIFALSGIIFDIIFEGTVFLDHWDYTKMVVGSIIVGIAFNVPALIYKNENLSKGLQVFIHMGIGLLTYGGVAFYVGWIPLQAGAWVVATTIAGAVIVSFAIWFGFYIYYKKEAKRMNAKIKERQEMN